MRFVKDDNLPHVFLTYHADQLVGRVCRMESGQFWFTAESHVAFDSGMVEKLAEGMQALKEVIRVGLPLPTGLNV